MISFLATLLLVVTPAPSATAPVRVEPSSGGCLRFVGFPASNPTTHDIIFHSEEPDGQRGAPGDMLVLQTHPVSWVFQGAGAKREIVLRIDPARSAAQGQAYCEERLRAAAPRLNFTGFESMTPLKATGMNTFSGFLGAIDSFPGVEYRVSLAKGALSIENVKTRQVVRELSTPATRPSRREASVDDARLEHGDCSFEPRLVAAFGAVLNVASRYSLDHVVVAAIEYDVHGGDHCDERPEVVTAFFRDGVDD